MARMNINTLSDQALGVELQRNKEPVLDESGERADAGTLGLESQDQHPSEYGEILAALFNAQVSIVEAQAPAGSDQAEDANQVAGNGKETAWIGPDLSGLDVQDLVGIYLKEAARMPLLTHEEEKRLFLKVEQGRLAREALGQRDILPERKQALLRQVQEGWVARERLVQSNTRLVVSIAKKYMGRGVPFLDLIQEGNIGLMRALKKYDLHRGFKFSTYATWWIRQAVSRSVANDGHTIRMPVHIMDKLSKLARAKLQLTQKLQRDPTDEELAAKLESSIEEIQRLTNYARLPVSLDQPINSDTETTMGDLIENERAIDPEEGSAEQLLREHVSEMLKSLPPREARTLGLRYGLLDGEPHTLQQVGKKLGVSRERVRQIEAVAMRRLRKSFDVRQLRAFIE